MQELCAHDRHIALFIRKTNVIHQKFRLISQILYGILTPRWLTYVLDEETAPIIKRFGVNVMGVDESLPLMDGAKAAIDALSAFFFDTLSLKSRLSDLGIDESNFEIMAKKACAPEGVLYGFTNLTPKDVEAIYRMCL